MDFPILHSINVSDNISNLEIRKLLMQNIIDTINYLNIENALSLNITINSIDDWNKGLIVITLKYDSNINGIEEPYKNPLNPDHLLNRVTDKQEIINNPKDYV